MEKKNINVNFVKCLAMAMIALCLVISFLPSTFAIEGSRKILSSNDGNDRVSLFNILLMEGNRICGLCNNFKCPRGCNCYPAEQPVGPYCAGTCC
ncbi:hypothetical protein G4B88_002116 [Cannabis sativa]|uniref:Uncharacterized protein n=1 Tax=Cannabis sativa TaxID=3483 RepID=A0A7J6F0C4_CANSA|nr:hypothetical protein G4B88_002116 [Cannabis sativa]